MVKKLSVIIVTYNSKELIFDCLDSIYGNNDINDDLEVIIVDNNSQDQEELFATLRQNYPVDLKLIKNPKNGGYGCGNNLGVSHSLAKHFIVMNPDIRILNPIFKKLISEFEQNVSIGMMGVTFADKSNSMYFKPEYSTVFKDFFLKIYMQFGIYSNKQMYMSGSFLMFDKKIFIEAGQFDENLFLYYEEADISNRILKAGKNLVLAKDIKVYHLTHNRTFNTKALSIVLDSLEYYLSKYQLPSKKILKNYLIIYKIKYLVAIILRNDAKKKFFKDFINILEKRNSK